MTTQQPKYQKIIHTIIGFLIFSVTVFIGIELLQSYKLTGAEFVSLVSIFAVISLLISLSDQVQEFSIAGNLVKLKEVKHDVQLAIIELQYARDSNFRALLKLSLQTGGALSDISNPKEERVNKFWDIFQAIKQANAYNNLTEDILSTLESVIRAQRYKIMDSCSLHTNRENEIHPDDLLIERLEPSVIDEQISRTTPTPDIEEVRTGLKEAIREYRKLYNLREQLRVELKNQPTFK
ncbi:hypothetical protein ACUM5Y_11420 [Marinomonas dokdonensis]|uniref:hypothetical protein n=1 Tax=Marinomonas dokdonensis TaxID=328224 RepID=UPI00405552FD